MLAVAPHQQIPFVTRRNGDSAAGRTFANEALPYIATRLGPTPTLILGTYRSTEVDDRHPLTRVLDSFRGDRRFALVHTRLDREWFVRSPDADPVENAAAAHLDEILVDRIAPATLRWYWAHWLLHQLRRVVRSAPPEVVDWHLDMAESRLA